MRKEGAQLIIGLEDLQGREVMDRLTRLDAYYVGQARPVPHSHARVSGPLNAFRRPASHAGEGE